VKVFENPKSGAHIKPQARNYKGNVTENERFYAVPTIVLQSFLKGGLEEVWNMNEFYIAKKMIVTEGDGASQEDNISVENTPFGELRSLTMHHCFLTGLKPMSGNGMLSKKNDISMMNWDFFLFYSFCDDNVKRGWMNTRRLKYFKEELKDTEFGDPYVDLALQRIPKEDTITIPGAPEERRFYVDLDSYHINKNMSCSDRDIKTSPKKHSWCYFFDKERDEMMYVPIQDSKYVEGVQYNEEKRIRMARQREVLKPAQSVKILEDSYHYVLVFYLEDPVYLYDQSKHPKNRAKAKEKARNQRQEIPDDEEDEESEEEDLEDIVHEYTNTKGGSLECFFKLIKAFKRSSPWITCNRNEGGIIQPEERLGPVLFTNHATRMVHRFLCRVHEISHCSNRCHHMDKLQQHKDYYGIVHSLNHTNGYYSCLDLTKYVYTKAIHPKECFEITGGGNIE
jgi:hypothetical protein